MKVIIAGSRHIDDIELVRQAIKESGFDITAVISGMCRGVDLLGWEWARENGFTPEEYPANWKPDGILDRSAGIKRNVRMANAADALIAVYDGKSKGTGHMIHIAKIKGLKVYVKIV